MRGIDMQKKGNKGGSSTQSFLELSEIKDDVIVARDGGLRAVVAVSSTNFILKSKDEQDAIIARYQAFLNALEFPIQILMQSRHLDVHGYLEKIQAKQMQQKNELLRMQTEEYVSYVSKLLEYGNIMNKTFYVIVPFNAGVAVKSGFLDKVKSLLSPGKELVMNREKFIADLQQLNDRAIRVSGELSSMGLQTMRLTTPELVELLFNSYNIASAQRGRLDLGEINLN